MGFGKIITGNSKNESEILKRENKIISLYIFIFIILETDQDRSLH